MINTVCALHVGSCSAVDLGTDMLELDCHLTKDEEVVVSHDSNLRRSTGINAKVCDMAYAVSYRSEMSLKSFPFYFLLLPLISLPIVSLSFFYFPSTHKTVQMLMSIISVGQCRSKCPKILEVKG